MISRRDTSRALNMLKRLRFMLIGLVATASISPVATIAQADSTMVPIDSNLTVIDSSVVGAVNIGPGITSEEFDGYRRIIIPGSRHHFGQPAVSCTVDSGLRQFGVMVAPYDTTRLGGTFSQYFSGARPLKYKALFPDSLTLQLTVQTTLFSEIRPSYDYQEKQIYIDIIDKVEPVKIDTETVGQPKMVTQATIPPAKQPPVTRSYFGFQNNRPTLVMALVAAVALIIFGAAMVMLLMRGMRRPKARQAHEATDDEPADPADRAEPVRENKSEPEEIINPVTTSPSAKTDPPEKSAVDTEIRTLMKQHGVTYDEARIMVWMKQRGKP